LGPCVIPPFGSLFGLPTLCDERLGDNEVINFNAGDHSISLSMRYADYVLAEKPELGTFAEEETISMTSNVFSPWPCRVRAGCFFPNGEMIQCLSARKGCV
jgi:hypothetical protein